MFESLFRLRHTIFALLIGTLLSGCAAATNHAMPATELPAAPSIQSASSEPVNASATSSPGYLTSGSYAFTATYSDIRPAIEETANANTHLAIALYTADPILQQKARIQNTYQLETSLASMKTRTTASPRPATLEYDIEHWSSTPLPEQNNPASSIATAAAIAHNSGFKFAVAPDMNFMGFRYLGAKYGCSFNMSSGIVPSVAWAHVDILNLQIQRPANSACSPNGNYQQLRTWVNQIVSYVRHQNPNIFIQAQFSTLEETASQTIGATDAIKDLINGVYVAYPDATCSNCSDSALLSILRSL